MADTTNTNPGWYPDPAGRHEYRWWDGTQWTDDVSSKGKQSTDRLDQAAPVIPQMNENREKIQQAVAKKTGAAPGTVQGGGTLFTEPILVVNQKAKLFELTNEYGIFDQHGTQIGAVREVGQSAARKVLRAVSSVDMFLSHTLQIVDAQGALVLQIVRPKAFMKNKFLVQDAQGNEIGQILQENRIGKIRFGYVVNGQKIGSLNGENWRAWKFNIRDETDAEIARVDKTWQGFAKAAFTSADNYVVQISRPLEDPLRSLVLASALSIDTALSQASR
ncbi:MAG TPA: phospholipid scramblase-related protein [Acidimicrobiales bacterium]|jgi:uncharacterized protein YxjI|nr:phospholipid scramblase-related protein [Acidimicrobiales bacterium]